MVNYLTLRAFWVEENTSLALLIDQYLRPRLQAKSVDEIAKSQLLQTAMNFTRLCRSFVTYPAPKPVMNKIFALLNVLTEKFRDQNSEKQHDQAATELLKAAKDLKSDFKSKSLVDLDSDIRPTETTFAISTLQVRLGFKRKIKILAGQKNYINYFFPKSEGANSTRVLLWKVRVLDLDVKFSLIFKKRLILTDDDPTRSLDQPITIHGNAKLQSCPEYSCGYCKIDHSGIYSFILDNSYSIFKPKTVKIWICVLEG